MLRESAKAINTQVDLKAITDDDAGDGNIPHGGILTAFAEAVLGDDEGRLDDARRRVREAVGDAGFVDASAVIANYSALDRVADATGIPLEAAKEANTVELRTELGIDNFA
jgi:hypothetical protein